MSVPGLRTDSPAATKARERVPEELRPQFESLLEDYAFAAFKRYGRAYVSYEVIADLVIGGWRGPEPSTASASSALSAEDAR